MPLICTNGAKAVQSLDSQEKMWALASCVAPASRSPLWIWSNRVSPSEPRRRRIVTAEDPYEVRPVLPALAEDLPVRVALGRSIGRVRQLFPPTFVAVVIFGRVHDVEHHDHTGGRDLVDNRVSMSEVGFVRRREIVAPEVVGNERVIAGAISGRLDGELSLDQAHQERVEASRFSIGEVGVDLCRRKIGDETPGRIGVDAKWRSLLIDEVPAVGRCFQRKHEPRRTATFSRSVATRAAGPTAPRSTGARRRAAAVAPRSR